MNTVIQKYGAGIASFLVVLLTAVSSLSTINSTIVAQLIVLAASSFVMFLVPLLPAGWRAGAKVGVELLGALVVAVIPFLQQDWTAQTITLVVIALIKAAAVQLGVIIRTDASIAPSAALVAAPAVSPLGQPATFGSGVPTVVVNDGTSATNVES